MNKFEFHLINGLSIMLYDSNDTLESLNKLIKKVSLCIGKIIIPKHAILYVEQLNK